MAVVADKPLEKAVVGFSERILDSAIQEHHAKMSRRRSERARRLPDSIRCLDAEHAANVEAKKPKSRFSIKATIQEFDQRLKRMVPIEKSGEVDAHNQDDAWAIFCDKWKVRAGPNHCNRIIVGSGGEPPGSGGEVAGSEKIARRKTDDA